MTGSQQVLAIGDAAFSRISLIQALPDVSEGAISGFLSKQTGLADYSTKDLLREIERRTNHDRS